MEERGERKGSRRVDGLKGLKGYEVLLSRRGRKGMGVKGLDVKQMRWKDSLGNRDRVHVTGLLCGERRQMDVGGGKVGILRSRIESDACVFLFQLR